MSGIGGIVAPEQRGIPYARLTDMSKALLTRGADRRGGYWNEGVGLFCGQREGAPWQPTMVRRGECNYVAAVDGRPEGSGALFGKALSTEPRGGKLVLEYYRILGADLLDSLAGEYALAIWDEERREMLLARDPSGKYPLFYRMESGELLFASEIKALLRTMPEGAPVDRGRLRAHLLSAPGTFGGEDLYCGIFSVPRGGGGIFSRLGMTLFSADGAHRERGESPPEGETEAFCPEAAELEQMLTEALFAFDYPQFDGYMPALIRDLTEAKKKKRRTLTYPDGTRWISLAYAGERGDRLGSLYGIAAEGRTPQKNGVREREWKRMDRILGRLLGGAVARELDRILGAGWLSLVEGERNLLKRIRIEGMLYQTVLWEREYRVIWT